MAAVRDYESPLPGADGTPAAGGIRNPGCRPAYSYRLARPMSMCLCVGAPPFTWPLSGTFIVYHKSCKNTTFLGFIWRI